MRVPRPPPLAGRPPKREPRPCLSERFHLGNTPARQSALRFSWAVTNAARFGTEKALEPLRRASDTSCSISLDRDEIRLPFLGLLMATSCLAQTNHGNGDANPSGNRRRRAG